MKTIASWHTLFQYAKELGQAELSGDAERIKKAKKKHDEYVTFCLEADEMIHAQEQNGQ